MDEPQFIAEYRALHSVDAPAEIARLAASMAPAPVSFDPSDLVDRAIAIRAEAERTIRAKSAALLHAANSDQLRALALHILKEGDEHLRRRSEEVEQAIRDRRERDFDESMKAAEAYSNSPEGEAQTKEYYDSLTEELASWEKKCGPFPGFPCNLETALRWSTRAPSHVPDRVLQTAFSEYSMLARANYLLEQADFKEERKLLEDSISWHGRIAANEAKTTSRACADSRKHLEAAQADLNYLDELTRFVRGFSPGESAPPKLVADAEKHHQSAWEDEPFEAEGPESLRIFADKFEPFWGRHRSIYVKAHEDASHAADEQRRQKKNAGRGGAAQIIRKRWITFTQDFLESAGRAEITRDLINSYPKQANVPEDKGREFLNTLLAAKGNHSMHSDLELTLERVGINVPQALAADCYFILFEGKIITV